MRTHTLFLISLTAFLTSVGCEKTTKFETGNPGPKITLTEVRTYSDLLTVKFSPDERTSAFEYALGLATQSEQFEAGTMEGIEKVDSVEERDVTFEGLDPQVIYTVFARGYDSDGNKGPVAMLSVRTITDAISVDMQYAADNSAAFMIHTSFDYYRIEYALGKASDKEAFDAGTLEGTVILEEVYDWVPNFFGLTPETDYSFFMRAYDRMERPTIVYECPFTTLAVGSDFPDAEFTVESTDVYRSEFTFTPNSSCGKMIVLMAREGQHDIIISDPMGFAGDLMRMLPAWVKTGEAIEITEEDTFYFTTPELATDNKIEAYVMVFDESGEPFSVKRWGASTPSFDESLPAATVTATISNITAVGATYTFTAAENTLGFLFDTVDADWYDDFKANDPGYYDNYLRDRFLTDNVWWRYKMEVVPFTEQEAEAGKRYYIGICPINENGLTDPDWGALYLKEYTTLLQ